MYNAVAANKRNTIVIMALFVGLISAFGWAASAIYGDMSIFPWIIGFALVYAVAQYFIASSVALALSGGHEITKKDNPRFWRIVENLSITTGLPMPKVYIIDDPAPNAMATGRDPKHASVAATTGILELMTDRELEAVMAHEIGHVKNYDIRVSMIVFGLVSAIALLSDIAIRMMWYGNSDRNNNSNPIVLIVGIVVILLAPLSALLIQSAVSRQREYLADATGALTTRDSEALASALEKLQQSSRPMQRQNSSTAHLFFANPLKKGFISRLFSTHPPLEDRIVRLRENANKF